MERKKLIFYTAFLMMIASACSLPFNIQRTDDFIATAAEQTVQAYMTETAPIPTPLLPTQTVTTLPTATYPPQPAATLAPLPTATPRPCNRAVFVSETVPDGTTFNAGQSFSKSWRLRNEGTCTWNPDYRLVFFSGDQMSGPNSVKLDKYVKPGEQVDFLVNLKAPSTAATYTGYWRLQADDGSRFAQIFTQIKVAAPFFAVTSVKMSSVPASHSGECPVNVTFSADITASTAGTVTYWWEVNDGILTTKSAQKSEVFSKQGTKTVQLDLVINDSSTYQVWVYIDKPNNQLFWPHAIQVECT
jgi:hypothetical protein